MKYNRKIGKSLFNQSHSKFLDLSCDMTKPTKWACAPRRLRSAWASTQSDQSSLCTQWVAKDPRFLHVDSEDSDQTGCTVTLLVLSCRGSFLDFSVRHYFPTYPWKSKKIQTLTKVYTACPALTIWKPRIIFFPVKKIQILISKSSNFSMNIFLVSTRQSLKWGR